MEFIEPVRPKGAYDKDSAQWQEYAYRLAASYNLHRKHIAAKLGIPLATIDHQPAVMARIRDGWADFQKNIMGELLGFALANPLDYEDPAERAQVRNQKLDAVKTIAKTTEKREEMEELRTEGDLNREALKDLSPEALQAELRKYLK